MVKYNHKKLGMMVMFFYPLIRSCEMLYCVFSLLGGSYLDI